MTVGASQSSVQHEASDQGAPGGACGSRVERNDLGHGSAGTADDDLLTLLDSVNDPRQVGLRAGADLMADGLDAVGLGCDSAKPAAVRALLGLLGSLARVGVLVCEAGG